MSLQNKLPIEQTPNGSQKDSFPSNPKRKSVIQIKRSVNNNVSPKEHISLNNQRYQQSDKQSQPNQFENEKIAEENLSDLGIHEDVDEYDDDLFEQPFQIQKISLNEKDNSNNGSISLSRKGYGETPLFKQRDSIIHSKKELIKRNPRPDDKSRFAPKRSRADGPFDNQINQGNYESKIRNNDDIKSNCTTPFSTNTKNNENPDSIAQISQNVLITKPAPAKIWTIDKMQSKSQAVQKKQNYKTSTSKGLKVAYGRNDGKNQLLTSKVNNQKQVSLLKSRNVSQTQVNSFNFKKHSAQLAVDPVNFSYQPSPHYQSRVAALRDKNSFAGTNSNPQSNPQIMFESGLGSIAEQIEKTKYSSRDINCLNNDKSVINVHQHFNQPNIMNFNHNDYFDKINKNMSHVSSPNSNSNPNLFDEGLTDISGYPNDQFDLMEGANTIQRGKSAIIANRKRIVSSINPNNNKRSAKSIFYKKLKPFIRASSTQNLQNHLMRRQERPNSLIRNLKNANPSRYGKIKQSTKKLNMIIRNRRMMYNSVKSELIDQSADFSYVPDNASHATVNNQHKHDSTFQNYFHHPSGAEGLSSQKSVENCNLQSNSVKVDNITSFKLLMKGSRQKAKQKAASYQFNAGEKESMQSELFLLKTQLNMFKENNMQLRTQNLTKLDQIRAKQKLIEELVAITEVQDQRNQTNFNPSQYQNETQTMQRVRLIQQVNDLKQKLGDQTKQFNRLRKDVKSTQIQEIQMEIQIYQQECIRLRSVSEQALQILTSHGLSHYFKQNNQLKDFFKEAQGSTQIFNKSVSFEPQLSMQMPQPQPELDIKSEEISNHIKSHHNVFQNGSSLIIASNLAQNSNSQIQVLQNKLTEANQKLKSFEQIVANFKKKETHWIGEKSQLNLLLKQATNIQDQYQDKMNEKEQQIENLHHTINNSSQNVLEIIHKRRESINKKEICIQTDPEQPDELPEKLKTLQIEKQEAIEQVEQCQITVIQQNKDYIELQKMYKTACTDQKNDNSSELNQLKQKDRKLQEINDQQVESSRLLLENLKKTVQKLNHQLDECQLMNEQLFEELNIIKEKLIKKNIRVEEFSSESENSLAQIKKKKKVKNRPPHQFSVIKREKTEVKQTGRRISSPVQIINEEYSEEEDNNQYNFLELISPKSSEMDKMGILMLQEDIMKKNIRNRKSEAYLRANSHINPGMRQQQLIERQTIQSPNGRKQSPGYDLLAAIDKINDGQTASDFDITSGMISQVTKKNIEMRYIVQREDPSIQIPLRRVARMQQIKRLNLDFIERELFDENFKVSKKIKLVDLANIFVHKLGLNLSQANSFARFLVEEVDENNQNQEQIHYNPRLKINYSIVVVRLMTYSLFPTIFRDIHEIEARNKFRQVFSEASKQAELMSMFDNDNKTYEIHDFISNIDKCVPKRALNDQTIDCVYVILCRRVQFSEIHCLSDEQLVQCLQGFQASSLSNFFENFHELNHLAQGNRNQKLDSTSKFNNLSSQYTINNNPRGQNPANIIKVLQLEENKSEGFIQKKSEVIKEMPRFQQHQNANEQFINHQPPYQNNGYSCLNSYKKANMIELAYSEARSETDWDMQESRRDILPTQLQEFVRKNHSNKSNQKHESINQSTNELNTSKEDSKKQEIRANYSNQEVMLSQFILTNEQNDSENIEEKSPNFKKPAESFDNEAFRIQQKQNLLMIKKDLILTRDRSQDTAETQEDAQIYGNIKENANQNCNPSELSLGKQKYFENVQIGMASFHIESPIDSRAQLELKVGKIRSTTCLTQDLNPNQNLGNHFNKSHTKKELMFKDDEGKSSQVFTLYEREKQSNDSSSRDKNMKKPVPSFKGSDDHHVNNIINSMTEIQQKSPEMSQKGEFVILIDQEESQEIGTCSSRDMLIKTQYYQPDTPIQQYSGNIMAIQENMNMLDSQSSSKVDDEVINQLKVYMTQEFNSKIEDKLKATIDNKGINKIVGICVDVLVLFSFYMKEQGFNSLRAYFQAVIYTVNVKNNIEVIKNIEIISKIEECLQFPLEESQRQAIMIVWQNQQYQGYVLYHDFERCMEILGHHEDYPQYHNQIFKSLDSTSIRILNSLQNHLETEQIDLFNFLDKITEIKKFRTKDAKTKDVICVALHTLFIYLYECRIINDSNVHEPFREFMCFNKSLNQLIPLDKFAQILNIASQDQYCKSFQTRVRYLPVEEQIRSVLTSQTQSIKSSDYKDDIINNTLTSGFKIITSEIENQGESISQSLPTNTFGDDIPE